MSDNAPDERAAADGGLPPGFAIRFDADAREVRPGVWFGGQPARVLTLSTAATAAVAALRAGPVRTATEGLVARRLTDAGLAHPVPPGTRARADVTVVVPVHDRPEALERCLISLGTRYPVVVVDDASADELRVRAIASRHGAAVVRHPVNRGPAAARNTGLTHVGTELVAFVDSDTVPGTDWLDRLAAHLDDPLVAAVAPRVVALRADTAAGRYTRARGSLDLGPRPARVAPYTRVSYVPTAALLARRQALGAVARSGAVFDESLRVGEDVDLVWRLVASGARVRFDPGAAVAHDEPQTWRALLGRRFAYGTSAAALAQRHPDNLAPLVVYPWPAATVVALLAGRPAVAAAGAVVTGVRTGRALRRAGVPADRLVPITAASIGRTWLGVSRYAVQFGAPALATLLACGSARHRVTAAAVTLTPALAAWRHRRGDTAVVPFLAGALADDIAYGAGVLAGCRTRRTTVPLRPAPGRRGR